MQDFQHEVQVHVAMDLEKFGGKPQAKEKMQQLAVKIESALEKTMAGELTLHQMTGGWYRFTLNGPDSDAIYNSIVGTLKRADLPMGSFATKRLGGVDAAVNRVDFIEAKPEPVSHKPEEKPESLLQKFMRELRSNR